MILSFPHAHLDDIRRRFAAGVSRLVASLPALLLCLAPAVPSLATEPAIEDLTEQVVTGVAVLAEKHGVREAVVFDHPLDRTAHLLAELVASSSVRQAGYETHQRVRQLEILVLDVQSADRRGLAVPEAHTRDVLSRSVSLLDELRLEASLEPQPSHLAATCEGAETIGFTSRFGSTIFAANDGSSSCGASASSPDRWYRFVAPATETVVFEIASADFDAVLSLHSGCPGTAANELACNDDAVGNRPRIERAMTAGEEVRIRVSGFGGAVGDFVLAVRSNTGITGFVTNAVTSAPLGNVGIDLFSSSGFFLDSTVTDSTGSYRFDTAPGSYFVRTFSSFLDELYDDIPCESSCSTTSGNSVPVVAAQLSRADFALSPTGSISGTVTETATGDPLGGSAVARDLSGRFGAQAFLSADGSYQLLNLPPQGYRVRTITSNIDERWDDQRCENDCADDVGSAITVVEGQDTPNIDFVLDPAGSIEGTITDRADAQPLANVRVQLSLESGSSITSTVTDIDGTYAFGNLSTANYRVFALDGEYLNEAWDDIACQPCSPTTGDLIAVTEGAVTTGIDFALDLGGILSGTVTNASTADGLFATVTVFDSTGQFITSRFTNSDGTWEAGNLVPGSYTARARDFGFLSQLFDGIDCPSGCDPLDGTPIVLALSEQRSGIDFALTALGELTGTVADTLGSPVAAQVRLFDDAGSLLRSTSSSSFDGFFRFNSLQPGTYFLTVTASSFFGELFDDSPCLAGDCDPATGTPIVISSATTTDINIGLSAAPSLTGRVTHQITGEHLQGVSVEVLSTGGDLLAATATDETGIFVLRPQFLGNAKLRARSTAFDDELFEEIPCEGGCDLSTGRTFNLTAGAKFLDLDFTLTGCDSPNERTVQFFLFKNPTVVEACRTVTSGEDVTVGDGGDVTFRAGESIVLGDGFAVLTGGSFKAEIVPELAPAP